MVCHEHAQPMVERLIACAEVRQDQRHVNVLAARFEDEIVRRERPCSPVLYSARASRRALEQALCARWRGWWVLLVTVSPNLVHNIGETHQLNVSMGHDVCTLAGSGSKERGQKIQSKINVT